MGHRESRLARLGEQVGADGDLSEVGGSDRCERILEVPGDRRDRTWRVMRCEE